MKQKHFFFSLLLFLAFLPFSAAASPIQIRIADRFIASQTERILFFAHPTATFQRLDREGAKQFSNGNFKLTYTFHWLNLSSEKEWTSFSFSFDSRGQILEIENEGRSTWIPPFTMASLALSFFKKWMDDNKPELAKHPLVKHYLKNEDAKGLLTVFLRFMKK